MTNASCSTQSRNERIIRRIAGAMVLVSVALGYWIHPGWLGLGVFVGLNLFQSSFTGFCPLDNILNRMNKTGANETAASL